MALADGISWTCIGLLYVGFASGQGWLAHASRPQGHARIPRAASYAFAPMVLVPATVLVFSMPGLPVVPRLGILALGIGAAVASFLRPPQVPVWMWSSSVGRLYLAVTMALAALWALLLAAPSAPSSLIGAASVLACLSATLPGSRRSQVPHLFEVE